MATPNFHLAKLSSSELSYLDSWDRVAVADRPAVYTTVVGLHGIGFNAAAWTPLLAALPPTLRFVAYNQRSYKGSSPRVEIKEPGGVDAMKIYLNDLLEFIEFVASDLKVPAVPAAAGPGGITVLVRSVLARPFTPNFLAAMGHAFKPDTSEQVFADASDVWLKAYSPGDPDESLLPPSGLKALTGDWGKEAWEPHCLQHGMAWKFSGSNAEVRATTEKALAKVVPGSSGDRLETLPVGVMCGSRTGDYFEDARQVIVEELWAQSGEGRTRKTAQRLVEGTNHFAFIHEPKKFAVALEEIVVEELGAQ
ncbi:hypothetical protein RQP46_006521 [Phenoliferia psychrophenolica]